MISVIIPVYNEEGVLKSDAGFFQRLSLESELIFVDGGSTDNTFAIAKGYSRTITSSKGRAAQMNSGAAIATEDIMFFLHADSRVSSATLGAIEKACGSFDAGCLTHKIKGEKAAYRVIEAIGNARAKLTRIFYGDQGIFVKRGAFYQAGGFPDVPVMEDVLFSKRLRGSFHTGILKETIEVSARRWEKQGLIATALNYSFINLMFWFNLPLKMIRPFYPDIR